jgi:uncharacterized protein (DUF885 family)
LLQYTTMFKTKNILPLVLCLSLGFTACNQQHANHETASGQNLEKVFKDYYEERLALYPIEATSNGDSRYDDKFYADFTDSYRDKLAAFYNKYKQAIEKIDRSKLDTKTQIDYDCFVYDINQSLESFKFHSNYMPLGQIGGAHLMFAQMGSGSSIQPFKTVKDYDNWLKRMDAFGPYMDSVIVYFQKGVTSHWVLPKVLVAKMIPQMRSMQTNNVQTSIFYKPILNFPKDFSAADKERLQKAYSEKITTVVEPAYKKVGDYLEKEYLSLARNTSGVWDLPDGKAFYDFCVHQGTSTNMTADEIYNLGLSEVARIKGEMEGIKTTTGFKGDLKAFFNYLDTDKKFTPFTTNAQILQAYHDVYTRMQPQLKKLFINTPKTPFEIREVEAFRAKSASSEYNPGSPDGSRPGIFYVLILDPKKYNVVAEQMESLFLHEAIPGHHYQISLQQEDTSLPDFRRFSFGYNAYIEGWALYCESLGKELGLYTDPYQYMGALGAEMHRAIRLVVDAGMHSKKMTREEAIKYMMDNEQINEEGATIEIERYMNWPGQALGYKIGSLTIARLRKEATEKMGKDFNIAAFHNEVLKYGCMPLNVLEQHIHRWEEKK